MINVKTLIYINICIKKLNRKIKLSIEYKKRLTSTMHFVLCKNM